MGYTWINVFGPQCTRDLLMNSVTLVGYLSRIFAGQWNIVQSTESKQSQRWASTALEVLPQSCLYVKVSPVSAFACKLGEEEHSAAVGFSKAWAGEGEVGVFDGCVAVAQNVRPPDGAGDVLVVFWHHLLEVSCIRPVPVSLLLLQ
eukprot:g31784.t1